MKAIENLMLKKGKFDYILLETTGLADPGPIASMFWLDEGLGSEIYLDGTRCICDKATTVPSSIFLYIGIVTVLDSKHCMQVSVTEFSLRS